MNRTLIWYLGQALAVLLLLCIPTVLFLDLPGLLENMYEFPQQDLKHPTREVKQVLERAPTNSTLYAVLLAAIGIWMVWRWIQYWILRAEFEQREPDTQEDRRKGNRIRLTSRDWWVVFELRKRALGLRIRADIVLASVFFLLLGGIYAVWFILPQILEDDRTLARESVQLAIFGERFGRRLRLITEGRYWLKTFDGQPEVLTRSGRPRIEFTKDGEFGVFSRWDGSVYVSTDRGASWEVADFQLKEAEGIVVVGFSEDGFHGVLGGSLGSVYVTTDRGATWSIPRGLSLQVNERLSSVALGASGTFGLFAGDKGSLHFSADRKVENWSLLDGIELKNGEQITAVIVAGDGGRGVVAGKFGSIFISDDQGKTWNPFDVALKSNVKVDSLWFTDDGRRGVLQLSDNTLLLTRDGGRSWVNPNSPLATLERILVVELSRDGNFGLITGDEGSVFSFDGNEERWKSVDLNLQEGEAIRWAALSRAGEYGLMVSDRGSVFERRPQGENWKRSDVQVTRRDRFFWRPPIAVSPDGKIQVIADPAGTVFFKTEYGNRWGKSQLQVASNDEIKYVWVTEDGSQVLFETQKDAFFVWTLGNRKWTKVQPSLKVREKVASAYMGRGGNYLFVSGNKGSQLLSVTLGRDWLDLPDVFRSNQERVTGIAFSEDGNFGLLGAENGALYETKNSGDSWVKLTISMLIGETLGHGMLFSGERSSFFTGNKGSVFVKRGKESSWVPATPTSEQPVSFFVPVALDDLTNRALLFGGDSLYSTSNQGASWNRTAIPFKRNERVTALSFSRSGQTGIIVGDKGSMFLTYDYGRELSSNNLDLRGRDLVSHYSFSNRGDNGVVATSDGLFAVTLDWGETWQLLDLPFKDEEQVRLARLSDNGRSGVLAGGKGSVHLTSDGGKSWRSFEHTVKDEEVISLAAFSTDGAHGVLAGNRGSVFLTTDGGGSWKETEIYDKEREFRLLVSVPRRDGMHNAIAVGDNRAIYFLRNQPEFLGWDNLALGEIRDRLDGNLMVRKDGLFNEMGSFLDDNEKRLGNAVGEPGGGNTGNALDRILDNLTVMRAVTLVILFFLVHLLVRIFQYNLRLSSFWESRGDAVLLAQSFAKDKAKTFDGLVPSLGPDAYDYRAIPRSFFDLRNVRRRSK